MFAQRLKSHIFFRLILIIVAISGAVSETYAQFFEKDNLVISAGMGGPNLQKSIIRLALNFEEDYKINGLGVFHAKLEYGINENFGLGLSTNYSSAKMVAKEADFFNNSIIHTNVYELSSLKFNLRGNYHFGNSEKFDTYLGGGIGMGITKYKSSSNDPNFNKEDISIPFALGLEATIGLRYYPVNWLGVYSEFGLSKSIIQGGIVIKI